MKTLRYIPAIILFSALLFASCGKEDPPEPPLPPEPEQVDVLNDIAEQHPWFTFTPALSGEFIHPSRAEGKYHTYEEVVKHFLRTIKSLLKKYR